VIALLFTFNYMYVFACKSQFLLTFCVVTQLHV